jgi:hypothetical protein
MQNNVTLTKCDVPYINFNINLGNFSYFVDKITFFAVNFTGERTFLLAKGLAGLKLLWNPQSTQWLQTDLLMVANRR